MEKLILGAGIVGILIIVLFAYKDIKNKDKENKKGEKRLVVLSKTGSIIFYSILCSLFIFFLIMYIMWKSHY